MPIKTIACKKCGFVIDEPNVEECPNCQNKKFTTFWKGAVIVNDPENSIVAKKLNIENKGKYALRIN